MSLRNKHSDAPTLPMQERVANFTVHLQNGLNPATFGRGRRISKAHKKAWKSKERRSALPRPPGVPVTQRNPLRTRRFHGIARAQAAAEDPDDDAFLAWKALWRPPPDPPPDLWRLGLLAPGRPLPCMCPACFAERQPADWDH